jgi:hypothetical protein
MDVRFKAPFTACLSAGTKCGKTEWAKKFVKNASTMIHPPPDKIYWAYGEWQEGYKALEDTVIFIDGVPDLELFKSDKSTNKLLICDDLMQAYGKNKDELIALFCKGSHHWNLSILHILQNLFFSNMRTARVNSHYMILMKNPSDRLQLMTLANQIFPRKQKRLIEAYDDACSQQYGYLLLDLEPSTPDNIRLRTNIFPGDNYCIVYEPRV